MPRMVELTCCQTAVSVSSWCAHHNAANFEKPDSFVPERWLDNRKYTSDNKLASRPFSLGPRGCIGKELVYIGHYINSADML